MLSTDTQDTVVAPTLLERARARAAQITAADEEQRALRRNVEVERARSVALNSAWTILGVKLEDEQLRVEMGTDWDSRPVAYFEVDGLRFHSWTDWQHRPELYVERRCVAAGCLHPDKPVLQEIDTLTDVVIDLLFQHSFRCAYPLGEDGEPIIPEAERPKPKAPPRDFTAESNAAVAAIEAAAERLARATVEEMELLDARPLVKAEAIKRIMARDAIAATPAEKIVETDPEFAAHRRREAEAVVEKIRAEAAYETAKRRADVAIDMELLFANAPQA